MTVRLETLELVARPGGWISGRRSFGSFLTFVTGENGAGKTPVMKAMVYALGHAVKLTDHVKTHCSSIKLTLAVDERKIPIERTTDDDERRFLARATDGSDIAEFEAEPDFTEWLLTLLKIPLRPLAGKEKGSVIRKPYASVLGPVFWLDQDRGWQIPYSPLHTKDFVKNQGEEAVRWVLGVAQRHPAVDKKDQLKLENEIETVESLIRARQAAITELRADLTDEALDALGESKRRIVEQLRARRSSLQYATSAGEALTEQLGGVAASLEHARRRRAALAAERQKLLLAAREIEADQEVLLANENAADLFRRVCSNGNCGFFRQPSESYGRRLLYVKDQLKDLQSAASTVEMEVQRVDANVADLEQLLKALSEQRKLAEKAAGTDKLVVEVDALAGELQTVTLQLVRREQLAEEERRLSRLITRRHAARDALDQLTRTRRKGDDRTRDVKASFEKSVVRWLGIVNTPNLEQVGVNDNFELTVKGRRFNYDSPESGSTRTRFVLAYHAALLETSISVGGHHPPWLLCDAPRQQEIKVEHLVSWVEELRALAKEHPFQLVMSGKEVFTKIDDKTDVVWRPTFSMNEPFPQYLGPATTG